MKTEESETEIHEDDSVKGVGSVSAKPDYITLLLVIESTDKEYDLSLIHI